MKFEIDSKIIEKANCDKDFVCLKENVKDKICKINRCLDEYYCLLKEAKFVSCNNRFTFGYSDICKCPVRIEIYNKYDV